MKPYSFKVRGFASSSFYIPTQSVKDNLKTPQQILKGWNGKSIPLLIDTPCRAVMKDFTRSPWAALILVEYNVGANVWVWICKENLFSHGRTTFRISYKNVSSPCFVFRGSVSLGEWDSPSAPHLGAQTWLCFTVILVTKFQQQFWHLVAFFK